MHRDVVTLELVVKVSRLVQAQLAVVLSCAAAQLADLIEMCCQCCGVPGNRCAIFVFLKWCFELLLEQTQTASKQHPKTPIFKGLFSGFLGEASPSDPRLKHLQYVHEAAMTSILFTLVLVRVLSVAMRCFMALQALACKHLTFEVELVLLSSLRSNRLVHRKCMEIWSRRAPSLLCYWRL